MSIKCKHCSYDMTTFEFLGHLTAELFEILKGRMTTRSIGEHWDCFMCGFANDHKITCPICEKYVSWMPETIDAKVFTKTTQNIQRQKNV